MKLRLFLAALSWLPSVAFAGGMISSGGEYVTLEENPWFVGETPVTWCVDQGTGFSADPAVARDTVRAVLTDWSVALGSLFPARTPQALPDGQTKTLTLRFTETEPCTQTTELVVRLGAKDPVVDDALRYHARDTLALALSPGIDETTGRVAQGRIWLAPDLGYGSYGGPHAGATIWQSRVVLYDVLLHELGHVFGMPHTRTGFMQKTYPADVAKAPPRVHDSAQLLVRESWWPLARMVCGDLVLGTRFDLGAVLGLPNVTDGPICMVPADLGPGRVGVHLIVPQRVAGANMPTPGAAQTSQQPLPWPEGEGVAIEPDQIAGMYYGAGATGQRQLWEHVFVEVPAHVRLRGTLTGDGHGAPVLLEQQGDLVDLILGQGSSFRIFRLRLDSLP